ncbi:uncharacterized protein J7T54_004272 [Emericellopsis cladophorae]|uniref:Uncharacterized protein n=1 Tax=Emericellopsis cladophorae TaxID=2686198 RepID=A0A9Q0BG21_9HYPO|nr:uncharacterized protein J7T54_004272 [Emericellopsis cladophorae]KAI6783245.1 hypothetical protein J7T54_004272 [Emericellopsis cladophorae]
MTSMKFPFELGEQWQMLRNLPPEHVINHPWIKVLFIDRKDLDMRGMDEETSRAWLPSPPTKLADVPNEELSQDVDELPEFHFYWIDLPLYNSVWRDKCPFVWILFEEWLDFNNCIHESLPYN